jgi:hypothetical protein
MGQPSREGVHVDAVLTNVSVAYLQDQGVFASQVAFPVITVPKKSDTYYTYTKNDWFRDEAQQRADATESAGSGYNLGTSTYNCDVYAFHKDIGNQTRSNADSVLDVDSEATKFVTQRMLLRQEIQWVTDYFTTSVWDTDITPSNKWSDYVNSDPIEDIETGKEAIYSVTGYEANVLIVGYQVWRKLKRHPDFREQIKYTSRSNITPQMVADMLEVDRVVVAKALKATNTEGETEAYAFTHGKHALLCHAAPSPGLMTPSCGYTFAWDGVSGGLGEAIGIGSIDVPLKKATRIESESAWDNKVVGTDLGYFFNGAVA